MEELDIIINRLRQNPLFYISQTSKELFHSNFWGWLAHLNTLETIRIFTEREFDNGYYNFKREHNQSILLDGKRIKSKNDFVLFEGVNPVMVIENKVKDFPSKEQLERIRISFNNNTIEFVLVTLFWVDGILFQGWENVKRYSDIANRINSERFTNDPFELSLISHYKEFCQILHSLALIIHIEESYDFTYSFNNDLLGRLNQVKLAEGYLKMRSSHLLLNYVKPYDCITYSSSINHQKATISFNYPLRDGYSAGVQLEDNQFRYYIQGTRNETFAENLRENNVFFRINWTSPTGLPYLGYSPDFKYQFDVLAEPVPFNELFKKINQALLFIHNNVEDIESLIP